MVMLTEVKDSSYERVLVTGLSGAGKTTLVSKLAEKFNLIWLDVESGKSTLFKLPREWQERINLISIPDSASYPIAADTIIELFRKEKANICAAHGKHDCALCKKSGAAVDTIDFAKMDKANTIVVVDTVTQVSHSILAHLMRGRDVTAKPERDDWGGLRKHTEALASQWQAANYHLVCIAHLIEATLEDGKVKLVPNFGSAGMSAEFAKFFSHVVYVDVVNKKHKAFSSSTYSNSVLTKSRTDFRIEDLAEPSLLPLFAANRPIVTSAANTETETETEQVVKAEEKSQGAVAVDKLAALRAKMSANKS